MQPLSEAGLDSLGTIELRNALSSAFNVDLPATLVFDYPSISQISDYIASFVIPKEIHKHSPYHGHDIELNQHGHRQQSYIISWSCRFGIGSNCSSPWNLWEYIIKDTDSCQPIPNFRWNADDIYSIEPASSRSYARFAYFATGVHCFDHEVFQLTR